MLLELSAVHLVNREHRHIHNYINEGEDITTLRDLLHKQYDDAVDELFKALTKVLDKQFHAQQMACVSRPNVNLAAMLMHSGITTEGHDNETHY